MSGKKILIVLGGTYHDFDAFVAATMGPVLVAAGHSAEATYDLDTLTDLHEGSYDLVLLYTCLGGRREDGPHPVTFAGLHVQALVDWVRGGGTLLAVHSATVAGQSSPAMKALLGGVFVEHPPRFTFTVYPVFREHPITAGIAAFAVHDEFYMEVHEPSVDIHMVALDRGVAYPMVWTRSEGQGRVAHIAMGHDAEAWDLKPYRRLMRQAIDWLTA